MRNDLVDNIRLNMNAEQVRACVYVRAGDTRARTLHFTIVKDGQVVDMTDLVIAELVILKPDGHECDQSMTRYGNELHYTLRTQDINVPGDNRAQVQMTFSDGTVYESPEFSIMVYDKLDPRYETSTNEYTALNAKLALADETVEDAQEALDAAEALLDDAGDLRDEMVQLKNDTEGFKNDASGYASDASGYASDASGYATSASGSATLSESWAVGGTNTRAGEDTNNSKYFSQQAANSASSASGSATAAAGSATSAQSWAVGGTGTRTGEDTNNAKYWSDTSSGAASDALLYKNDAYNSEQDAASHASDALAYMTSAYNDAKKAESWAVGGTGTRPGEDTNNAKYWATQATVNDGTLTITQNGTPLGTFTANSASNVSIEVPGGGGGGHTVITPDGTMPQRGNMYFTDVHGTDDSVNDDTKLTVFKEIQQADFELLTPTEQTTGGYIITDANPSYIPANNCVSVTADGVKSYADLLNDLSSLMDYSKLSRNSVIVWTESDTDFVYKAERVNQSTGQAYFEKSSVTSSRLDVTSIRVQSASKVYAYVGGTITDQSGTVPTSGTVTLTLYYNIVATEVEKNTATVTGNIGSVSDTWAYFSYPTGFDGSNCVLSGVTALTSDTNIWYSNNPNVVAMADSTNGIRIKTTSNSFLGQPFKILLTKV